MGSNAPENTGNRPLPGRANTSGREAGPRISACTLPSADDREVRFATDGGAPATGGQFPGERDDGSIRLLTWNISHGEGMDGRIDVRRTADLVGRVDPDVVALQEVDREFATRSNCEDQPRRLAELLDMDVEFAANVTGRGLCGEEAANEYGTAIATAGDCSVVETEHRPLPNPRIDGEAGESRGLQAVLIDAGSYRFRVYCTHLDAASADRRAEQVAEIVRHVDGDRGPHCLAGDFNATPDAPELAPLFERYRDAFATAETVRTPVRPGDRAANYGTYPAAHWRGGGPNRRIDYVFASDDAFTPMRAALLETIASDHCPVIVDLGIRSG